MCEETQGCEGPYCTTVGCENCPLCEEMRELALEDDECYHIALVSISATEMQCMDCLQIWPKVENFKSDWPQFDRG